MLTGVRIPHGHDNFTPAGGLILNTFLNVGASSPRQRGVSIHDMPHHPRSGVRGCVVGS